MVAGPLMLGGLGRKVDQNYVGELLGGNWDRYCLFEYLSRYNMISYFLSFGLLIADYFCQIEQNYVF